MAYSDWTVAILDVVAKSTADTDPDGHLLSTVTYTVTHKVSGQVWPLSEVTSTPSADAVIRSARSLIDTVERNQAAQTTPDTPSVLIGVVDITVTDARTQSEKNRDAFNAAERDLQTTLGLVKALKATDGSKSADLDKVIAPKAAARKTAAAAVITDLTPPAPVGPAPMTAASILSGG